MYRPSTTGEYDSRSQSMVSESVEYSQVSSTCKAYASQTAEQRDADQQYAKDAIKRSK